MSPEDLLNTIKMPKNPRLLKEKLPKPQYDKEMLNNSDGELNQKERHLNSAAKIDHNQLLYNLKQQ